MCEDKGKIKYRGRIAPTPSGYLHEGHFSTFKVAWNRARENEGVIVYRNDDLDQQRSKDKFIESAMRDLKGWNIDWDEGPDCGGQYGPYNQSERSDFYEDALIKLVELQLVYPCMKSRKEINEFGMRSNTGNEYLFPKEFRAIEKKNFINEFSLKMNWRFRTNWGDEVCVSDSKLGDKIFKVGEDFSDFLVWRKDGVATYELATVVDDYLMKITEIVRGEDLLLSSARQCIIFDALSWRRPSFNHCELVIGADGKKLSKSRVL